MLDWRNSEVYRFTEQLNAAQWAWEFLRRNPRYRQEWQAFHATWQALEVSYGKPGRRDMTAWKRDPRAWVPAHECRESDCRVDGEKVLIECAMGARWGFYKFPPDPADDDPVGGGRLTWREINLEPIMVTDEPKSIEGAPGEVILRFDLSMPLRDQLASAKRLLQIEQRKRVRAGLILAPNITANRDRLRSLLRLLDALEAGADSQQILSMLYPEAPKLVAVERQKAIELREQGYRLIPLLE